MHLLMTGWPVTACNREPWLLTMETTTDLKKVTCRSCLLRESRLSVFDTYAGEMIRWAEIYYWRHLSRAQRYRYAKRNPETEGLQAWHWYQFSSKQRELLLRAMVRDGQAAWEMGLPGVEGKEVTAQDMVAMLRTARNITRAVRSGKQPAEHLGRVTEILNTIGRTVAGGDQ